MRRAEIEEAIAVACKITRQREVYVIGSQAILGSYTEDELPPLTTASVEVDIAPAVDIMDGLVATLMEADYGEDSSWHAEHGWYIQGVERGTAVLPDGWEDRLVELRPAESKKIRGLCLSPYDLCVAKLARLDTRDQEFVDSLIDAELIDPHRLRSFVDRVPDSEISRYDGAKSQTTIRQWVMSREQMRRDKRSAGANEGVR
jgi:hypothetical protein